MIRNYHKALFTQGLAGDVNWWVTAYGNHRLMSPNMVKLSHGIIYFLASLEVLPAYGHPISSEHIAQVAYLPSQHPYEGI